MLTGRGRALQLLPGLNAPLDFAKVYQCWYHAVLGWISAFGAPLSDREDIAQEVFIVVQRRLPFFDGVNLAGWLYRISRRRVRDYRELVWVKDVRRRAAPLPDKLPARDASALEALETIEKTRLLSAQLARLGDHERSALLLFELEGYRCEEIAQAQSSALGTVWARIHHARKKLRSAVATQEARERRHLRDGFVPTSATSEQ